MLAEVAATKAHPANWDDDYTKKVIDWARQYGIRGAIDRHSKGVYKEKHLPWSTVDRWLQMWKATGTYYTHSKRGRKEILSAFRARRGARCCKKAAFSPKQPRYHHGHCGYYCKGSHCEDTTGNTSQEWWLIPAWKIMGKVPPEA